MRVLEVILVAVTQRIPFPRLMSLQRRRNTDQSRSTMTIDCRLSLLDVPHSFPNMSASGLFFSWELTRFLVGSDAKEQVLDVPRFKTIESHKTHGIFFTKLAFHGKCRLDKHINLLMKLNYAIQVDKLWIAKPSTLVRHNLFYFLQSNDINV